MGVRRSEGEMRAPSPLACFSLAMALSLASAAVKVETIPSNTHFTVSHTCSRVGREQVGMRQDSLCRCPPLLPVSGWSLARYTKPGWH